MQKREQTLLRVWVVESLFQRVTQVQLAQLSNVGYRFVLDLEAGKETIQLGKVLAVMETLGMRVNLDLPPGSEVENG